MKQRKTVCMLDYSWYMTGGSWLKQPASASTLVTKKVTRWSHIRNFLKLLGIKFGDEVQARKWNSIFHVSLSRGLFCEIWWCSGTWSVKLTFLKQRDNTVHRVSEKSFIRRIKWIKKKLRLQWMCSICWECVKWRDMTILWCLFYWILWGIPCQAVSVR
jgi:hypothetical protein